MVAIQFRQGLEEAWTRIATFIPKLLGFLAILIIGYFVAKAIAKLLSKVLERVGFNGWVERGGVRKALEKSKYDASDILAKLVFYTIFLFVLQLAFGVFGPNPISELLEGVIAYLPRLFVAIIIVVVAAAIAAAVREIVDAALGGLTYGSLLANLAGGAIIAIGIFAALDQLQIAPAVVNGLFYALLVLVVGSAVIAIGGGGIVPMRQRWERALQRLDQEAPRLKREAQGASDRVQQRADQRTEELRREQERARERQQERQD